jgi:phosphotriesterase-related protein
MPSRSSSVPVVLDELEALDAPVDRISLSHMDSIDDFRLHEEALDRGLWINYDCFGMALSNDWYSDPGDGRRIEWLLEHFRSGRADRVLVAHDTWCKAQLHAFGGGGYGHLLVDVAPRLRAAGLAEDDLDRLFRRNPARFLAWARPA